MTTVLPPTLIIAVRSGQLHGRTLAVFVELHEWIGTEQHQPVKAWCIAERLSMSQAHVYRAIRVLVGLHYLEPGALHGGARTYRIVANPASAAA